MIQNKHPRALYVLFFTEMWERFSYYGMRGLLVIFCVAEVSKGGLGWSTNDAGQLYGLYTGAFYFTMLFGGLLADKYLGQQRSVIIGAILIMIGHLCLAMQSLPIFFTGLGFLIIGGGFFKPNVSSLVGQLYPDGSPLKDSAYTIFYMGINIGSIGGILVCGYLGEKMGWHYGFGAAAIGMAIGLTVFLLNRNRLGHVGLHIVEKNKISHQNEQTLLTKVEKDRIWVIVILSIFSIAFWMAFEQAGSSISIFALKYTDRVIGGFTIPASWFNSLNPLFIILFAPVLSLLWTKLGNRNPSNPFKFGIALTLLSIGFLILVIGSSSIPQGATGASVSILFIISSYFLQTMGELCLSPIGLAAVNKLSPPKYYSILFGVWFFASAIGSYISGYMGGLIESISAENSMSYFFLLTTCFAFGAAIIMFSISKLLKKLMHGIE